MHTSLTGFRENRYLTLLEKAYTVAALFIFSRSLIFQNFTGQTTDTATSGLAGHYVSGVISRPHLFWVYIAIYCIAGLLLIRQWRELALVMYREKYISLLLILAALSALWSIAPLETLAKGAAMSGCTLFGCYFALRYRPAQQLRLLELAFYLIVIASFAVVMFYYDIGVMHGIHEGLWRGALVHKNMLGTTAALGSVVFFLAGACSPQYKLARWTGFCLSLLLLVFSSSKLSLISYCIIISAVGLYLAIVQRTRLALVALASVIFAGGCLGAQSKLRIFPPLVLSEIRAATASGFAGNTLSDPCPIASFIRRIESAAPRSAGDDTATGRVDLWRLLWRMIEKKPWLGYGLGGFWLGMDGPSSDIWNIKAWHPPSGHNGFLDLWLHLGLVGVCLFCFSFVTAGYHAVKALTGKPFDPVVLYIAAMLAFIFLANTGESDLFSTNYILWICFVSSAVSAQKYIRDAVR